MSSEKGSCFCRLGLRRLAGTWSLSMESGTDLLNIWFCRLTAAICYLIFFIFYFEIQISNIQIQYFLSKVVYYHLCIRSVQGGLASPSKLFGSCTSQLYRDKPPLNLYCSLRTTHYQKYLHANLKSSTVEAMLHVFTAQFWYSRIIVKTMMKPNFFTHIIVNAVSPHLNIRF